MHQFRLKGTNFRQLSPVLFKHSGRMFGALQCLWEVGNRRCEIISTLTCIKLYHTSIMTLKLFPITDFKFYPGFDLSFSNFSIVLKSRIRLPKNPLSGAEIIPFGLTPLFLGYWQNQVYKRISDFDMTEVSFMKNDSLLEHDKKIRFHTHKTTQQLMN